MATKPGEHKTVQARILAYAQETSTAEALAALVKEIEKNEQRKKDQAAKGMGGLRALRACAALTRLSEAFRRPLGVRPASPPAMASASLRTKTHRTIPSSAKSRLGDRTKSAVYGSIPPSPTTPTIPTAPL